MANVLLSAQALVTVEEALSYLSDQGSPADDQDLLRMHINAVTALIIRVTNRDRLVWVDDDTLTEYRAGDGTPYLYLKNAPVRKLEKITLLPMQTTNTELTGPTEPEVSNSDMWFEPTKGLVGLKNLVFPAGHSTVKIEYEAGFYQQDSPSASDPADPEILGLKMIALDAIATKWARWKNGKHGISSESRGETSINYTQDDFRKLTMAELKRYRRHLFA